MRTEETDGARECRCGCGGESVLAFDDVSEGLSVALAISLKVRETK